jgi:hypothetical protein
MKVSLKALTIIALVSGAANAETYSGKTYLSPRPVNFDLPMELSTWHNALFKKHVPPDKLKVCGRIAVTPFYQATTNKTDIGKYFGVEGYNTFKVVTEDDFDGTTVPVTNTFLIHDAANAGIEPLAGTVTFEPKQELFGARIDYFQDIFKGFFFKAALPIVHVKNDMGMKITDSHASNEIDGSTFTLEQFFKGEVSVTTERSTDLQSPLTKGKIDGSRSATGVADIDLGLGYKLFCNDKSHLFVTLAGTIPTGKKPTGEWLFEPIYGNGQHFGLGGTLDGGVELWASKKASISLLIDVNYRYLFDATEDRILGLKESGNDANAIANFNHYYMVGTFSADANKPLQPAANVLTQGLKVKPGSLFDAMAALSFRTSGFVFDLGYDLFYKEKETVELKDWTDDVYGIAIRDFDTTEVFADDDGCRERNLNKEYFNLDVVTNPSQVSHKIFGSLGYLCNVSKKYPTMLGLGGSYEFKSENSIPDKYEVWVKAGIAF